MAINLGNIVSIGGQQVGSGIVSGLDTASLVESLTGARRLPAVELETDVETNAAKVSEFNELRTLLENLKTASNFQFFKPITSEVIRVDTHGPGQSDVVGLPWSRVPRPMYPMEAPASWRG